MKIFFSILAILTVILVGVWFFGRSGVDTNPPENPNTTFPVSSSTQDIARLQVQYDQFLADPNTQNTFTTFNLQGKQVTLSTMMQALGGKIEPRVAQLLDQSQWGFYKCKNDNAHGKQELVLSMRYLLQNGYHGSLYDDQVNGLILWEQSLLADVTPIIFPYQHVSAQGPFKADDPSQFVTFRYAPINIEGEGTSTIGYIWVDDILLIGNSSGCLLKVQELLYDTNA